MRRVLLAFLLLWGAAERVLLAQSSTVAETLSTIQRRIVDAYFRGEVDAFRREIGPLKARLNERPFRDDWHTWYYLAFLSNQLGWHYLSTQHRNEDLAGHYLEEAQRYAEEANKRQEHAVNYLLLASAASGRLGLSSPLKAPLLGRKAKEYNDRAFQQDPDNPQVLLSVAMFKLFAPGLFGGDRNEARRLLLRMAEVARTYRPQDPLILPLGTEAEAYAYLALLEAMEENPEAARTYAQHALALRPDYAFPKRLLAELDRRVMERTDSPAGSTTDR
ncbi:MAG: hypothetical protein KatS3mg115_2218 [Candidatus Poribacteria bacterium]|nr:MAG: hypothetical protein KatS3mg115_2218 [Candidatus Poribacteria bacterium]